MQIRKKARLLSLLLILSLTAASLHKAASIALAAIFDRYADAVLGQPNFIEYNENNGGVSAQSLYKPGGIAVDPVSGRLYIADTYNNRILSWSSAAGFTNHAAADMVFGQGGDFTSNTANKGGISANSLNRPTGIAVDSQGNLYVADRSNHRVLRYNNPTTTDTTADYVFGQAGDFTTNAANKGGLSANSLSGPADLAVDSSDNLYIADTNNNRVLKFQSPTSDATADLVIGQPNFVTAGSGGTASDLSAPEGVALDATGNLYVADTGNFRVMGYNAPLTNHQAAVRVFGQESVNSNLDNCVLLPAANNLCMPVGVFVDAQGVLYISDVQFDRVLLFYTPLTSTPPVDADEVIGQPDFTSELNPKPPYSYGLDYPNALVVDSLRNLYLTDSNNNRALRYDTVMPQAYLYLPINKK